MKIGVLHERYVVWKRGENEKEYKLVGKVEYMKIQGKLNEHIHNHAMT